MQFRFLVAAGACAVVVSCATPNTDTDAPAANADTIAPAATAEPELNRDSLMTATDALRSSIEAAADTIQPLEMSTEAMRQQIAQKWSKIHYYVSNREVIRIKTYPHEAVSKRTEEFYFQNGQLVMAVIEDDGSGEKGKSKEQLSKVYYYYNGKPLGEMNNSAEKETAIRESDAERLLQEANEYLELMAQG